MKVFGFVLIWLAQMTWISWAQTSQVDFSSLSQCTSACLLQTFAAANCSITDTTCQCKNQELADSTSTCMISNCPLADSLALGKLREQVCQLQPESKSRELLVVNLTLCSLSIVAVVLRLLSRFLVSKRIYSDDMAIIGAIVLLFPFSAIGAWMSLNGLGKHTWDVAESTITKILQLFWIDETFYLLVLLLTKISLLLFYLRVFPSRRFQIWGKIALGFVILPGVIILLLQLLQCLPVRYNWDKSITNAKCLDVNALTYAHAGINIAQDFLILGLPIPELLSLQLNLQQKVGLFVMFQVGVFACITSIIRLRFLTQFGGTNSTDPLWDNANATIWTAAETNTAIICSCLPAIRALYKTGRTIASEAASKRKSVTMLASHGQRSRSSQLRSLDDEIGRGDLKTSEGLTMTELKSYSSTSPLREAGKAF